MNKRRKVLLTVLIAIVTMTVAGGILLDRFLRPYDLEHERAVARAAGIPIFPSDLKLPVYPPDQDAAPLYLEIGRLLKENPLDPGIFKPIEERMESGGRIRKQDTEAMRRLLASRPDVTSLVHRAAKREGATPRHTWKADDVFPHLAPAREAARILRWESLVMARNGSPLEAVHHQAQGFRMARQIGEDPILIAWLVSLAIRSVTLAGLEDILLEAGPDPRVAAAVRREIALIPHSDLHHAMQGEALFGQETIRSLSSFSQVKEMSGNVTGEEPEPVPVSDRKPGFLARRYFVIPSEAVYVHWMTRTVKATEKPVGERAAATKQVETEFDRALNPSPAYILTGILFPVFSKATRRETYWLARKEVDLSGAAVMEYRGRNGAWPARLDQAVTPVPRDPYGGKPLGYRREGNGFVVYSVGETGAYTAMPDQPTKNEAYFRYPYRPRQVQASRPPVLPGEPGGLPPGPIPGYFRPNQPAGRPPMPGGPAPR